MSATTMSVPISEAVSVANPSAIRVLVGYPWAKNENGPVSARSDGRWNSIRSYVKPVGEWIKTTVSRRTAAPVPFVFEVARLRGTHGKMLLDDLRVRIPEADILILDIGSIDGNAFNCNVLLETGMAIAQDAKAFRDIFILKPANLHAPSDLLGFLFTEYTVAGGDAIKLIDVAGFQAALRGSVLRKARERGMIGIRKGPYAGLEEESDDEMSLEREASGRAERTRKSGKPTKRSP
jgi:hypothetical protein